MDIDSFISVFIRDLIEQEGARELVMFDIVSVMCSS